MFVYLAEQDKLRDLETDKLKRQNEELASVTENQTAEIDKRQAEIERLAYSRKNEIDPDNYEAFKAGLKELTKTERKIFDLYIDGKSANEIADVLNIRESTLKFHNHNILENSACPLANICCATQLCSVRNRRNSNSEPR